MYILAAQTWQYMPFNYINAVAIWCKLKKSKHTSNAAIDVVCDATVVSRDDTEVCRDVTEVWENNKQKQSVIV